MIADWSHYQSLPLLLVNDLVMRSQDESLLSHSAACSILVMQKNSMATSSARGKSLTVRFYGVKRTGRNYVAD